MGRDLRSTGRTVLLEKGKGSGSKGVHPGAEEAPILRWGGVQGGARLRAKMAPGGVHQGPSELDGLVQHRTDGKGQAKDPVRGGTFAYGKDGMG